MEFELDLEVGRERGGPPIFVRIADAVAVEITRGRLRAGQRLPGTRSLAARLGVHRNTVVAAYRELVAQGWAQTHRASATVVSPSMPQARRPTSRAASVGPAARTAYALADRHRGRSPRPAEVEFNLASAMPDPRLTPRATLARAVGRVLRRPTARVLDYADARGHPKLRHELAAMLRRTRGLAIGADDIVVTRGSQMALYLVAGVLLEPGDDVAVEAFGYAPAWRAFEAHGGRLLGTRLDAAGLDVAALTKRPAPRAVYLTPHHQYPTTVTLGADRRLALLRWAAEHRVAIIEDDYDNEYHYDSRPVLPLAAADSRGSVAYVGTLSKVVAPGLRIGWVVGPPNLLDRVARLRSVIDAQGGLAVEAAVAELLEDGELTRHVWRTKRAYHERRDALVDALQCHLGSALTVTAPSGGMALWAAVDPEIDIDAWAQRARSRGVAFGVGRDYALSGRAHPNARFSFARHNPQELAHAVQRVADSL